MTQGMSVIVQKITKVMVPAIFLLGIYVILHGHVTPGGGFAGGILLAGSLILMIIAYGVEIVQQEVKHNNARLYLSAGLLSFWALAIWGLTRGSFFYNLLHGTSDSASHFLSGGLILFFDIAIGIGVSAALYTVFTTFLIARERSTDR